MQFDTEFHHDEFQDIDDVRTPCSRDQETTDQLERCGHWLRSIPKDEVKDLSNTEEYKDFIRAFERLGMAHRKVISFNRSIMSIDEETAFIESQVHEEFDIPDHNYSIHMLPRFVVESNFLQHLVGDDILLRIFEFLESSSLVRASKTCSRFRLISQHSAEQRTIAFSRARQLRNATMLLKAKEQVDGVLCDRSNGLVRVPFLLLSRPILVSGSGDPEYNGVYFCTGCNGNGFVFTKPRQSWRNQTIRGHETIAETTEALRHASLDTSGMAINARRNPVDAETLDGVGDLPDSGTEDEDGRRGKALRCIIAKRFSNETILWYMSKEVQTEDGDILQSFSFWAKLMIIGDASPDNCRYPSQTSVLARHGEGWQHLPSTQNFQTPVVEIV